MPETPNQIDIVGPIDQEENLAPGDSLATESVNPRFNVSDLFPPDTPTRESFRAAETGLEIYSANWQLSAYQFGGIVEGSEDINQSIMLALSTRKGSDPFRPTYGSDIWEQIDRPVNVAGPAITRAVRETITTWEPRVTIDSIRYYYQTSTGESSGLLSGIRVDIVWSPVANGSANQLLSLLVAETSSEVGGQIIRILATELGEGIFTELGEFILI